MIKVLIIDDEQSAIDVLKDKLNQYHNYQICGEALNLETALELTCNEKPDLVFLDVMLGAKTGFDYLTSFLPTINFKVIFITAYNEFAIRAFEFNAIDYLLKPIENAGFEKSLLKMNNLVAERRYIERLENLVDDLGNNEHQFIFIICADMTYKLDMRDLIYLEADGNYTNLYVSNGKKIHSSKTLKYYQDLLDKKIFFRIHHSFLINIFKVNTYKKNKKEVILNNNRTLPVAVRRSKEFLEIWCKLKN